MPFLFAANLLLTTRVFGAKIFPCSHRKGAALHVTGCMPPHPPSPPPALPFSGNPLSELFPFRSRRESNHTACRFTKKRGFFRLIWAEGRVLPPRVLATPLSVPRDTDGMSEKHPLALIPSDSPSIVTSLVHATYPSCHLTFFLEYAFIFNTE